MGRRRGQSRQPKVKGFRPGKVPAELRKHRTKSRLGEMNSAQDWMVEVFGERTPQESRRLIGIWIKGTLLGGIVLSVLGVVAWTWSWMAGVPLLVLAAVVFFSHFRLKSQRSHLEGLAAAVGKEPTPRKKRR